MRSRLALLVLLAGLLGARAAAAAPAVAPLSGWLEVRVFAAGHGDAILFRTPDGRHLLFDAGRATAGDHLVGRRLVPYFRSQGIKKLDAFFVSHPHWDHYGDPVALRHFVPFDVMYVNADGAYSLPELADPGPPLPIKVLHRGDRLRFGKLDLEVLHPPRGGLPAEKVRGRIGEKPVGWVLRTENNRSLVIRATFGKIRFLLTGDLQFAGERSLLRRWKWRRRLRAHVLKLGHHGRSSTGAAFLRAVRPRYAVATCGDYDGRWHRPFGAVLRNLRRRRVRLLRTDRHGDIVFRTDGRRLKVQTFPELVHRPKPG